MPEYLVQVGDVCLAVPQPLVSARVRLARTVVGPVDMLMTGVVHVRVAVPDRHAIEVVTEVLDGRPVPAPLRTKVRVHTKFSCE